MYIIFSIVAPLQGFTHILTGAVRTLTSQDGTPVSSKMNLGLAQLFMKVNCITPHLNTTRFLPVQDLFGRRHRVISQYTVEQESVLVRFSSLFIFSKICW